MSFVSLLDKCFNIASASYPIWTKQVNQDRSKSFNSFVVVDFLPNLDASLYFFWVDLCPNMDLCLSLCFISVESNRTLFNCLLNLLGENQNGNWYQGWTKVIRKEDKQHEQVWWKSKTFQDDLWHFFAIETMICRHCSIRIKKCTKCQFERGERGSNCYFGFAH